ncbi:MAG TPA: hypothetical protein VHC97_22785 [Thermoanaerobaculia bacterium]|jgi:hypothetical protein|nr:hypothetical protein [Thermoanaerobaculia bacterium]
MGWDTKRSYPVDASRTVTVRATVGQKARWTAAARRMGKQSAGSFVSWAADMAIAFLETWERANLEHADQINPPGSGL